MNVYQSVLSLLQNSEYPYLEFEKTVLAMRNDFEHSPAAPALVAVIKPKLGVVHHDFELKKISLEVSQERLSELAAQHAAIVKKVCASDFADTDWKKSMLAVMLTNDDCNEHATEAFMAKLSPFMTRLGEMPDWQVRDSIIAQFRIFVRRAARNTRLIKGEPSRLVNDLSKLVSSPYFDL